MKLVKCDHADSEKCPLDKCPHKGVHEENEDCPRQPCWSLENGSLIVECHPVTSATKSIPAAAAAIPAASAAPVARPTNLVLTRRLGERILIGDAIAVEVVNVYGGAVRLMVTAPREVRIVREELLGRG
jgi:carbon storage regulator